ncbi:MAG: transglutaminase-like domain-containing protein [Acidobacteriota bacterium]
MTESDLSVYLGPTQGVDCQSETVRNLAQRLTGDAPSPAQAAARLFAYVRDSVRYIPYAPFASLSDYHGEEVLRRGYGFCTQKSSLLVGLCRAAGLPARFRFADLLNHNLPGRLGWILGSNRMVYHTYVEVFLGGRWLKATPSFERPLCEKMGWRLVEFDGTRDAVLAPTDLAGRPHIEYVLDRGPLPYVPLEAMLETWYREYGPETLVRWRESIGTLGEQPLP